MKLSIIISYYKNQSNLELIFLGLSQQSDDRFEAIVSEDDLNEDTFTFLDEMRKKFSFDITESSGHHRTELFSDE